MSGRCRNSSRSVWCLEERQGQWDVWQQEQRARYSHFFPWMKIVFVLQGHIFSLIKQTAYSPVVRYKCLPLAGFIAVKFFSTDHIQSKLINSLGEAVVGKRNKRRASLHWKETPENEVAGGIKETKKTLGDACYLAVYTMEQLRGGLYIKMVLTSAF